jgi:hypothetical protein
MLDPSRGRIAGQRRSAPSDRVRRDGLNREAGSSGAAELHLDGDEAPGRIEGEDVDLAAG